MRSPVAPQAFLEAGAAVADITPPPGVGLLMSSVRREWAPFRSVRRPLKARALALRQGDEQVALLSLDLLGLTGAAVGGWDRFKRAVARRAPFGLTPDRIVIASTHTHTAPDSLALTALHRTPAFRAWIRRVADRLGRGVAEAVAAARPCDLEAGEARLEGYSLQRRIPKDGRIVMSDALQPISPALLRRGPVDRRVRVLRFRGSDGTPVATLVHAVCHPVHEMCIPRVSPDFPGEMCGALEAGGGAGTAMFLNGAAGDINPPTVCGGPACARRHGRALARAAARSLAGASTIRRPRLAFRRRDVALPTRTLRGAPCARARAARLCGLRIGPLAVVFLPGEPFMETALAIERASPVGRTLVVGYAEDYIGYLPPRRAFREGGYEVGPGRWSYLGAGAEAAVRREALRLLRFLRKEP